jgi:hypothetical protein
MGFLFPLFLLAGVALAIPVLIHLFNLRRYKRVNFPDTRFLRNIQLSTKRQSKIRNWRLLLTRLLFLAALVLAFAQPFFSSDSAGGSNKATVSAIYIDNSYSMTLGDGQENLLQQAKGRAKRLIASSGDKARFLILTNDRTSAMRPMLRNEALEAITTIKPVAKNSSLKQVMGSIRAAQEHEKNERWNVYFFTDLQKNTFVAGDAAMEQLKNTVLYFYPMQSAKPSNLYVDTAYFLSPTLDTRQPNPLVVAIKQSGTTGDKTGNLQVSIGGQVRAVSTVSMKSDSVWRDTLLLQLNGSGWKDITIAIQDHPLSFDDTFRIAARTAPNLAVLVVTDNGINPYLQAAFRTYDGFQVKQESPNAVNKAEWQQYSLVILQNLNIITPGVQEAVKEALQRGQNILLFPGNINNLESFNQSLKAWGDISFEREDTVRQQVVAMQEAHPLLQDLFEKVPDNVQLPTTVKRYPVAASIAANQQALMSFRDGKPFLAQYSLQQGKLYLSASGLDDRSSNFALSYFFVPILYKMAVQSGGGNIYALSIGSKSSIWLPGAGADNRKVWHLRGAGFDAIPSQRPSGAGVELFAGNTVKEPGFYHLQNEASKDTLLIGANADRSESVLTYADKGGVEQILKPAKVNWLDDKSVALQGWNTAAEPFPLWKISVLLALLALAGETLLLLKKTKTTPVRPEPVMGKA